MANEKLIEQMSGVKSDVRKRMDMAAAQVLAILWKYRSDFNISDSPDLDKQVNKILADMSDGNLADAEYRVRKLLEEDNLGDFIEDALNYAEQPINGEDVLFRLDMHASHFKELILGWLAVAAATGLGINNTRTNIMAYIGNPEISSDWRKTGRRLSGWGKGYQSNILNAITVVEQDHINRAYQYSVVQRFKRQGAIGYRTVRNSGYDCPLCDEMTENIWPLDQIVLPYHTRCVCVAVPVFGDTKETPQLPTKEELDESRTATIEYGRESLIGKTMKMEGIDKPVTFTTKGIKEAANQPHKHFLEKNAAIRNILDIAPKAKFVLERPDDKGRNFFYRYYATQIGGETSYIVIREDTNTKARVFFTIVDALKK